MKPCIGGTRNHSKKRDDGERKEERRGREENEIEAPSGRQSQIGDEDRTYRAIYRWTLSSHKCQEWDLRASLYGKPSVAAQIRGLRGDTNAARFFTVSWTLDLLSGTSLFNQTFRLSNFKWDLNFCLTFWYFFFINRDLKFFLRQTYMKLTLIFLRNLDNSFSLLLRRLRIWHNLDTLKFLPIFDNLFRLLLTETRSLT